MKNIICKAFSLGGGGGLGWGGIGDREWTTNGFAPRSAGVNARDLLYDGVQGKENRRTRI